MILAWFSGRVFGRSDAARAAQNCPPKLLGWLWIWAGSRRRNDVDHEIRQALSCIPDDDPWTHLQGGNTLDANVRI